MTKALSKFDEWLKAQRPKPRCTDGRLYGLQDEIEPGETPRDFFVRLAADGTMHRDFRLYAVRLFNRWAFQNPAAKGANEWMMFAKGIRL